MAVYIDAICKLPVSVFGRVLSFWFFFCFLILETASFAQLSPSLCFSPPSPACSNRAEVGPGGRVGGTDGSGSATQGRAAPPARPQAPHFLPKGSPWTQKLGTLAGALVRLAAPPLLLLSYIFILPLV